MELAQKILLLWLMLRWNIIINMFRCGTSVEDIIAMVDVEMEDLDRIEKELEGLTEGYELFNFYF